MARPIITDERLDMIDMICNWLYRLVLVLNRSFTPPLEVYMESQYPKVKRLAACFSNNLAQEISEDSVFMAREALTVLDCKVQLGYAMWYDSERRTLPLCWVMDDLSGTELILNPIWDEIKKTMPRAVLVLQSDEMWLFNHILQKQSRRRAAKILYSEIDHGSISTF